VNRIRTAIAAFLLASFVGVNPVPAQAQNRARRDRVEDRGDRREDRRDRREDRWDRREDRYDARNDYWDAARYCRRDDRRYRPRRLGKTDRIYRDSDNRYYCYYCRRDDGTTGLIVVGISGGVLGHIIAPGGSKTLGTIIGTGAGALIGRAVDAGDIVCRWEYSPAVPARPMTGNEPRACSAIRRRPAFDEQLISRRRAFAVVAGGRDLRSGRIGGISTWSR
jgi:hypothetical protein